MLGKYNKGSYEELASFNLEGHPGRKNLQMWCKVRVACKGPEFKVYFNRYAGDPDKGLRITYVDEHDPILSGGIGAISYKTDALYDNVVVMPIDYLTK